MTILIISRPDEGRFQGCWRCPIDQAQVVRNISAKSLVDSMAVTAWKHGERVVDVFTEYDRLRRGEHLGMAFRSWIVEPRERRDLIMQGVRDFAGCRRTYKEVHQLR